MYPKTSMGPYLKTPSFGMAQFSPKQIKLARVVLDAMAFDNQTNNTNSLMKRPSRTIGRDREYNPIRRNKTFAQDGHHLEKELADEGY